VILERLMAVHKKEEGFDIIIDDIIDDTITPTQKAKQMIERSVLRGAAEK